MNGNNDESLMKHLLESNSIDLLDLDCTKPTRSNFPFFLGVSRQRRISISHLIWHISLYLVLNNQCCK